MAQAPARIRIIAGTLYLVVLAVLAEATARVYWKVAYRIPMLGRGGELTAFYPALGPLLAQPADSGSGSFDVLLLSGSALHPTYGSVGRILHERLRWATGRRVNIVNLAMPAHTTLDSWLKYRALASRRFDAVLVYHGLNDVRVNNVPPAEYRDDYRHLPWYDLIAAVTDEGRLRPLALPYTVEHLAGLLRQRVAPRPTIARYELPPGWRRFGAQPRSPAAFERNLRALLAAARQRGEPVVLPTYAIYVPDDYSDAAFNARRLDYGLHVTPIANWGTTPGVVATVGLHNDILRRLAAADSNVRLVDVAAAMPRSGLYFNDICHLTTAGSVRFADAVLPVLIELAGGPPPERRAGR